MLELMLMRRQKKLDTLLIVGVRLDFHSPGKSYSSNTGNVTSANYIGVRRVMVLDENDSRINLEQIGAIATASSTYSTGYLPSFAILSTINSNYWCTTRANNGPPNCWWNVEFPQRHVSKIHISFLDSYFCHDFSVSVKKADTEEYIEVARKTTATTWTLGFDPIDGQQRSNYTDVSLIDLIL